eukprot:TRINITY_DN5892_c0_g1_i4.p1 TRINITY_DN5892_c0_g1~~TRINITY_DN5892_c0_g1_i4.p1  ORF type:complete len:224 (+),score=10.14 TRINITY_DN5892_c0_g1_i4:342-1013(+)
MLNINFRYCSNLTDLSCHLVSKCLKKDFELATLRINFAWCNKVFDSGYQALMNSISGLKQLKLLDLSFWNSSHLTSSIWEGLNSLIRQCPKLEEMYIDFAWCTNIKDLDLCFDIEVFSGSPLKVLSLDFTMTEVGQNTCRMLSKMISSFKELVEVNLKFQTCQHMTDDAACFLIAGFRDHFREEKIQKITLDFQSCSQSSEKSDRDLGGSQNESSSTTGLNQP